MAHKIYTFPKINFRKFWGYPCNTNNCDVEIEITLDFNNNGHLTFTVITRVWNPTHTQTFINGDGLELLQNFPDIANDKLYKAVLELYQKYQHQEIHLGSIEQETILHAGIASGELPPKQPLNSMIYHDYLSRMNMLTVIENGQSYQYGHGWLQGNVIPKNDIEMMMNLTK